MAYERSTPLAPLTKEKPLTPAGQLMARALRHLYGIAEGADFEAVEPELGLIVQVKDGRPLIYEGMKS